MKVLTQFDESKAKEYQKLPVVISAYQLEEAIVIPTLEGDMIGKEGDYLIHGIKGEIYPCKPDIFESTYKEVVGCDLGEEEYETVVTIHVTNKYPIQEQYELVCSELIKQLNRINRRVKV